MPQPVATRGHLLWPLASGLAVQALFAPSQVLILGWPSGIGGTCAWLGPGPFLLQHAASLGLA